MKMTDNQFSAILEDIENKFDFLVDAFNLLKQQLDGKISRDEYNEKYEELKVVRHIVTNHEVRLKTLEKLEH